jgi:hypothetical protein
MADGRATVAYEYAVPELSGCLGGGDDILSLDWIFGVCGV